MNDLKPASLRDKLATLPAGVVPLFVYGTLKRGGGNNSFLAGAELLASTADVNGHTLYGDSIPYMVRKPGHRVTGEVYAVDAATLEPIDRLEGHPRTYQREAVELVNGAGTVQAYVYQHETSWRKHLGSKWPAR